MAFGKKEKEVAEKIAEKIVYKTDPKLKVKLVEEIDKIKALGCNDWSDRLKAFVHKS